MDSEPKLKKARLQTVELPVAGGETGECFDRFPIWPYRLMTYSYF